MVVANIRRVRYVQYTVNYITLHVITWKCAKIIRIMLWRHMQQIQLTNAYTEHDCVTWGQCNDEGEGKGVRIWSATADGCGRWTWCHNVTIEPIFTILVPFLWPFCQARKFWERWTAIFDTDKKYHQLWLRTENNKESVFLLKLQFRVWCFSLNRKENWGNWVTFWMKSFQSWIRWLNWLRACTFPSSSPFCPILNYLFSSLKSLVLSFFVLNADKIEPEFSASLNILSDAFLFDGKSSKSLFHWTKKSQFDREDPQNSLNIEKWILLFC